MSIAAPATNPASDLELKLPATVGTAGQVLKNSGTAGTLEFGYGIEFDQWYLTSAVTSNGDITANLIRNNQEGAASPIGTGMTESSGIFTFPSTGKWLVIAHADFYLNDSDTVVLYTAVTTNNSSYGNHARTLDGNNGSGERGGSGDSYAFIDVTDTSQVKVKFTVSSISSGSGVAGESSEVTTSFIFIRLGDT